MADGKVYLVGAGPGDPGLFTLRGKEVLSQAEVVVYDYLANEELLSYAPEDAEIIYVGKKGGDHTLGQEQINKLLVEKGREKRVVRLKGGDPYVFGRGGEEAERLAQAGIAFEVVPGVSAAIAVPAYAGIPLSHRDHTASIAFITGHERADKKESKIAWDKLAAGVGTLVFFMGMKNLSDICRQLIHYGRSPLTPVAVIRWGTMPYQETVTGTLSDISGKVKAAGLRPPAIIVVGDVVELRDRLNWYETRPLFGRTIVVTRARRQASEFKKQLGEAGAWCIEFPTIEIAPPPSWEALDRAIQDLHGYDWIIFTSVNGVRYFFQRLFDNGRDVRALNGIRLGAIGPRTADSLSRYGLRLDLVPGEYRAEAILKELGETDLNGTRFLLPRAAVARDILPHTLRERGAQVDVVTAYQTVLPSNRREEVNEMFEKRQIDCLTFTSSSTVSHFFTMFEPEKIRSRLDNVTIACIGPITARTAEKFGLHVDIIPNEYTISGLTQAIHAYFTDLR